MLCTMFVDNTYMMDVYNYLTFGVTNSNCKSLI